MNYTDYFKIKLDKEDGYSIISKKTNTTYDLLEGKSYCGKTTSDIVFIMKNTKDGYKFVYFCYGASYEEDMIEHCCEIIYNKENKGDKE